MRHLMWILTWIAVAIGGALGAASVILLSASRSPTAPSSDVIAGSGSRDQPVLVNKPKSGTPGRSLTPRSRTTRFSEQLDESVP